MQQLILVYVAASCGLIGYAEAAHFERSHHTRCWGLPAWAWSAMCFGVGPLGAAMMIVAQHQVRTVGSSIRLSPAVPASKPDAHERDVAAPANVVASSSSIGPQSLQRHRVLQPQQVDGTALRSHARPRPSASHGEKVYLFGDPQSLQPATPSPSSPRTGCEVPTRGIRTGNETDLLPRRPPRPEMWRRFIDVRTVLRGRENETRAAVETAAAKFIDEFAGR